MAILFNVVTIILLAKWTIDALECQKAYKFKGVRHWKDRRDDHIAKIAAVIFARFLLFLFFNA